MLSTVMYFEVFVGMNAGDKRMLTMKGSELAYVVLVDEASKEILTLIISELIRVRNRITRRWRIHWRRLRVNDGKGGGRG